MSIRNVATGLMIPIILVASSPLTSAIRQAGRDARPEVPLPAESAGWDSVLTGLLAAFDRADVVMLEEAHGRKVDAELRLRLVRHPDFRKKVRFIIVEFANEPQQPLLARYVQGESVSDIEMRTIPAMFQELFAAIREVNQALPVSDRLRVLAGSPATGVADRNARPVALLREDVLNAKQRALVIYGAGHVWRNEGGITSALQDLIPGRVFVVETLAPVTLGQTGPKFDALDNALKSLEDTLQSRERPVLVMLNGRPAAAKLVANPFYLGQAMLPPDVTIGDNDDAVVYFGRDAEAGALAR